MDNDFGICFKCGDWTTIVNLQFHLCEKCNRKV